MKYQDEYKFILRAAVQAPKRRLPGIKDFVWAARRQTESPYTSPWTDKVIRRQITLFEADRDTARLTHDLLSVTEDRQWRPCHIDKDKQDDDVFDCEEVEFVDYIEANHTYPESFYDVQQYWDDTHQQEQDND